MKRGVEMSSKKQIKMKQRKQKAAVFDLVIKEARKYISIDDWRDKCPESLSAVSYTHLTLPTTPYV